VGDWWFGCDVCQEVCPWNRKAPTVDEAGFRPSDGMNPVELIQIFRWDDDEFRHHFRRTPLWRSKRRGLLRNAAIVLGNQRPRDAIMALAVGLHDAEPLVREACAWALGRYADDGTRPILQQRWGVETDPLVCHAIRSALEPDDS
jgi:epoxyqueuosine reductase